MTPTVATRLTAVADLCRRHRVGRLALSGSAATSRFDAAAGSDVDLLVEFLPMSPRERADSYFGLLEDLGRLFGVPVDLVEAGAIRNPYFKREIDNSQVLLFGAA